MTEFVKGKTVEEVHRAFEGFHDLVTGPPGEPPKADDLGKLAVFAGVREYPLSWQTLTSEHGQSAETARTE